jgi:hypothetical protein
MKGKEVDIEKLSRQNELMPAIGNMNVNARGDELGPGGVIIRRREDVVADYYETNPKAAAKAPSPAVLTEEMPAPAPMPTPAVKSKKNQIEE